MEKHAKNKHIKSADILFSYIREKFSRVSFGITGSVADGTHSPESDLDVMVVGSKLKREMQFGVRIANVSTAIVCLRPYITPYRIKKWALSQVGNAGVVSMVRSARIVSDPAGDFDYLKRSIDKIDEFRKENPDVLFSIARDDAQRFLRSIHRKQEMSDLLRLLSITLTGWSIKHGIPNTSKNQEANIVKQLASQDKDLFKVLRCSIPVTVNSHVHLREFANLVFNL